MIDYLDFNNDGTPDYTEGDQIVFTYIYGQSPCNPQLTDVTITIFDQVDPGLNTTASFWQTVMVLSCPASAKAGKIVRSRIATWLHDVPANPPEYWSTKFVLAG